MLRSAIGAHRAHERRAVGRDDLDRAREHGERLAVEELSLGEHDVGQEVAVAVGLAGEPAATSAPVSRPVTPMLPPKNRFATGTSRTATPAAVGERGHERREHLRAQLAGDDRDRPRRRGAAVADCPSAPLAVRGAR